MSATATFDNWMEPPHNRWAFHHVSDLLETAPISNNGGSVCPLPRRPIDLDDISDFPWQGRPSEATAEQGFSFEALNLEGVRAHNPDE
jgi:hypothetical protein